MRMFSAFFAAFLFAPVMMATAQNRVTPPAISAKITTDSSRISSSRTEGAVVSRSGGTTVAAPRAAETATTARSATPTRTAAAPARSTTARTGTPARTAVARAATAGATAPSDTKIGAAYEQCKGAYFACMDQFCATKNASFQRCNCSDKIYNITAAQGVMQDAATQLKTFNESLDTVGMTAAQATAMKKATEGENALTDDGSASKQLLQAIINSIKGEDASVGGKFGELNTISIASADSAAFGFADSASAIAAYNGKNLYSAIYSQCRQAVADDCTDATLQRAVTAYLMAVENDCNTVQRALDDNKKLMTASVRESGAMLDLARIQNQQKTNSSSALECLHNVELAVLDEQVCGAGYKKCLDNGRYIDVTTGKPLAGVADFYKLGTLLTYDSTRSIADQKLTKVQGNRTFVQSFESRVKPFAQGALDKCADIADDVWADYMDKAILEIYYAQNAKVDELKDGCMDFVTACYMNGSKNLTAAMQNVVNMTSLLQPDIIATTGEMCSEYMATCNNLFGGNVVADYIAAKQDLDLKTACSAIVRDCFQTFGGHNYANLVNPRSGLFVPGKAIEWFTYREYTFDMLGDLNSRTYSLASVCAQQLQSVAACNPPDQPDFAANLFGGFVDQNFNENNYDYTFNTDGIASEVYKSIISNLTAQCTSVGGYFVERRYLNTDNYEFERPCYSQFGLSISDYVNLVTPYQIGGTSGTENMCPYNYTNTVDTPTFGACLCWENGGRRSEDGNSVSCVPGKYNGTNDRHMLPDSNTYADPLQQVGKVCPTTYNTLLKKCTGYTETDSSIIKMVPSVK